MKMWVIRLWVLLLLGAAAAELEGLGGINRSRDYSFSDDDVVKINEEELDGGFSTLDGMLQWAIGNSNPEKLKETAKDVQCLSTSDLKERQWKIKEALEQLKMPSDAQLMQIAIADLNNSSLSLEEYHRALQELLVLVEVIDNANDLNNLGGLAVVIRELNNSDQEIRLTAAWILGKASQNNPTVQKQILNFGALSKLMKMVRSSFVEEATKALYAVSALIRNNVDGQKLFYADGGNLMLQDIMRNSGMDIRLRRKSAFLVADLAESQLENTDEAEPIFFSNKLFLKSVVDLTTSSDLDLQEKALMAIKSLLQLRSNEAGRHFKDFCDLDVVLERMRKQLQQLMTVETHKDLAMDMESLRVEVEIVFRKKLEKVPA
ncbi:hypothetical protein GIB67_012118 [Kingdonia uniflora]|uniref:Nucleotide exchange factor Fes1 domain-containing protein n=1 Tax=Kingdonia uniflora TaxID=39325 RepID=A0A7J7N942_9MAGN|nr:hypothetical protein GIB67_012118 [Kingdonia uniflora]